MKEKGETWSTGRSKLRESKWEEEEKGRRRRGSSQWSWSREGPTRVTVRSQGSGEDRCALIKAPPPHTPPPHPVANRYKKAFCGMP